jgi:NAD(P)-dependent dehydrogenase (short-subunit alcohol dehydrogenase family)
MRGLSGRTFLVTGATSGMGRATSQRLVAEGADVALAGIEHETGAALAAEATEKGPGRARYMPCDVRSEAEVEAAVQRTVEELGGLHGIVTCAGVFLRSEYTDAAEVPLETFEGTVAVNLTGTFLAIKHALPVLVASGGGSIVTIASTGGLRGHGIGAGYTASKGGVIALTKLVAGQYGGRGVRVNCICPGATAGEGMGASWRDPAVANRSIPRIPLARIGEPEDIAGLAAYLLSDDAAYVTGQVIAADGGATAM